MGDGPHTPHQRTGNGHDPLVGLVACGDPAAIAFTPPARRLPPESLDGFGVSGRAPRQGAADLRWVTTGPGALAQSPTRLGVAGFGKGALPAALPRGRRRGKPPEAAHPVSGVLAAGEVAAVDGRLRGVDFDQLAARAQAQHARVEERRLEAARTALRAASE